MFRLAIVLVALVFSLSGCAVYGGDYGYDRSGYTVRYYESQPSRYLYYDDRNNYRWHRDRYQDRRHSHYAPGYDGRYQWHDNNRYRHDGRRDHDHERVSGREQSSYGWGRGDRRQVGQLRGSERWQQMQREGQRVQRHESRSHKQRRDGWGDRR